MHRSLRLFVAITPPADLSEALLQTLASSGLVLPPHRLIPPEDQHLTLAFIGETRQKDLRSVVESVDRACVGFSAFALVPEAFITIPTPADGGPPRLVAARTNAPSPLIEMQRRLAMRLTTPKRNGHRARFLPHLTLARYAHGQTSDPIDVALTPAILPPWAVGRIMLYSSVLRADHAVYEAVHEARLTS